jgi:hypothetical protein
MEQIMAEMKAILKASYEEMKVHHERIVAIIKSSLEEKKSIQCTRRFLRKRPQ